MTYLKALLWLLAFPFLALAVVGYVVWEKISEVGG